MKVLKLTYNLQLITAPKIHTDLLWYLSFVFIALGVLYFLFIFFYRNRLSAKSAKIMQRKKELSPMISEFIFYEDDASKDEKSNYVGLKIEIRQLIKDDFNRKILSEILLDLQKDVSGDAQKRLFQLYQDLNLHLEAFANLKSWRWEVVSKAIKDLTQMQVGEAYSFIVKFINDKRATIRKQAEIATVTLQQEGLNYFLDTTKHKISEWQQLKLLDVIRNQKDYQPPRFKAWLTSRNSHVVLFALRLIKFYNQNDANTSLIELVKHTNNQIKEEAIKCIKEFHVVEALDTLKIIFWKSSTDVKISILGAIGSLGEEKDLEFLQLIENKVSNFYVKSKALSSINAISPESIMPSEGIQDTSNYQIPDDLPIARDANKTAMAQNEQASLITEIDNIQEQESNQKPELDLKPEPELELEQEQEQEQEQSNVKEANTVDEAEKIQVLEDAATEAIDLAFLPFIVGALSGQGDEKPTNHISAIEALKNLPVTFEQVFGYDNQGVDKLEPLKPESIKEIKTKSIGHHSNEELAFLPIVTDNIETIPTEHTKFEESPDSFSIHSLEVQYEIFENPSTAQIDEEPIIENKVQSTLISFDQYSRAAILNIDVVGEEILTESTKEQVINTIEVIEPQFLSFSISDLEVDLMDDKSNANPKNLPLPKEMNPQDEEKFRKIFDDLIDFERKEQVSEIMEEIQDSPLIESENELNEETEKNFKELDLSNSSNEKSITKKNIEDELEKDEAIIPKAELLNEPLKTWVFEDMSSAESAMQLVDDLSEMGDYREITLLKEMLEDEKYVVVQERIKKLIRQFSEDGSANSKQANKLLLKSFNVFDDLFRNCDTEAKLILLDEIVEIGDEDEIEFLESLLTDNDEEIQRKAAIVLEGLRVKLGGFNTTKIETTAPITSTNSQGDHSKLAVEAETQSQLEYAFLLEELEINPASGPDDIFDVAFEITVDNSAISQNITKTRENWMTSKKSLMNQLRQLTHKIIEKLNG